MRGSVSVILLTFASSLSAQAPIRLEKDLRVLEIDGATSEDYDDVRVQVAPTGETIMLFPRLQRIYRFSTTGNVAQRIDLPKMTNRLQDVRAAGLRGEGTIEIIESRSLARLRFVTSAGGKLRQAGQQQLSLDQIIAGCWKDNGQLVVLARQSSGLLHFIDSTGQVTRTVAEPLVEGANALNPFFSSGEVLCPVAESAVYFAPRYSPDLKKFDTSGSLAWQLRISAFAAVTAQEDASGTFRYVYPKDGVWDQVSGLFEWRSFLVVQTKRRHGPRGIERGVRTWIIDKSTGVQQTVGDSYPRFLAITPKYAIAFSAADRGLIRIVSISGASR